MVFTALKIEKNDEICEWPLLHPRLQLQFKKVLSENSQVTPGKPLSETYVFFLGKECYSSLDEAERNQVRL